MGRKEKTNFVCNAVCDPLANRPHRDVLAEKDDCYIGIYDSREQVALICSRKIRCSSDRTMKYTLHCNDALLIQVGLDS